MNNFQINFKTKMFFFLLQWIMILDYSFGAIPLLQGGSCDIFLTYSSLENVGRRIIAGRDFPSESFLFDSPTIFLDTKAVYQTCLGNYVFGSESENYSLIMIGAASLMNHSPKVNVNHYWQGERGADPVIYPEYNRSNRHSYMETTAAISAGEEMLIWYGEEWFESRRIEEAPLHEENVPNIMNTEERDFQVCLSDVYIENSNLTNAGTGLFAARSFKKGELVTVSPAALLPMTVMEESKNKSVLWNFCFYEEGSEVMIFPLGSASMINHFRDMSADLDRNNEFHEPNIALKWMSWKDVKPETPFVEEVCQSEIEGSNTCIKTSEDQNYASFFGKDDLLSVSIQELLSYPFIPLDLAYYAARDISKGEELTLDYGSSWESHYREWGIKSLEFPSDDYMKFRHYIQPSQDLFPRSWFIQGE